MDQGSGDSADFSYQNLFWIQSIWDLINLIEHNSMGCYKQ